MIYLVVGLSVITQSISFQSITVISQKYSIVIKYGLTQSLENQKVRREGRID